MRLKFYILNFYIGEGGFSKVYLAHKLSDEN